MQSAMLLFLAIWTAFPADTWPGFRGDGSSRTADQDLPVRWSGYESLSWRLHLPGYGQSSPIVWHGRIFVTAVDGAEKERCIVLAADANSGELLWRKDIEAGQKGANNPSMSRAAPTPVVDARGVYAFFESGDLIALDHSGKAKWQRSLSKEYGTVKNHHGLGSSLAQTENVVLVLVDHGGPSYLLAIDKKTGENLWKAERESGLSWTSPVVATHEGMTMVLVSSNGSLISYAADTGQTLWTFSGLTGNVIPSATFADDMVMVGAGESGLTSDLKAAAKSNCCLRLTCRNGKPGYELLWRGKKAVSHHASPVIHRGHVYLVTKAGVLYCFDLKTGKEQYARRLDDPCWATPVAAGDHVYFFGKNGTTTVIRSGPTFEKVASNRLWSDDVLQTRKDQSRENPENQFPDLPSQGREAMEAMLEEAVGEVVYGVAAARGAFILRTGTELYCIRQPR